MSTERYTEAAQVPYDEFVKLEQQLALFTPRIPTIVRETTAKAYPAPKECEQR